LRVKSDVTGIGDYFDGVYTSHEFGYAKEDPTFWRALQAAETFDPERTLFVDDTESVLQSAERFGLRHLRAVTRPDSTRPVRSGGRYTGVERVAELMPELESPRKSVTDAG
jgi:putative hydrolase of the HAD superfamily